MSQATTWGVQSAGPATMAQYAARDNAALDALLSAHRGASRPSYAVASTIWVKAGTAPVTDAEIYYFDGTNDILVATVNENTNAVTFTGLGTAAVLNVGTSANNIVQLNGSAQLPAVDGSLLTGIDAGNTAQIEANSANILLLAVRLAIQESATRWGMFKGFVDDFVDQSGVDLTASTGETYDAGTDVYRNGVAGSDETSAGSPTSAGGFSGAIFVDRSWSVDNGKTVSHVAFSSNTAAGDYDVYIFERIGSGSYTPRAKIASVSHPGGLAVTYFELASAYVVPATGDFYIGVDTQSHSSQGVTAGAVVRAARNSADLTVDTNYASGWTEETNTTVYVGVRYAEITETMTLVSEPETVSPAPTSARAIVLAKTAGGITLPGDLAVSISRDNGVTWTAGTLSLLGDYDADIEAFVTNVVDISGQPSGTSLRLRAVTADGKLIELSTWAVQAV